MDKRFVILWVLAITLVFSVIGYSEEKHEHKAGTDGKSVVELSPKLRLALIQEMQSIQTGMMSLIPAIASGNWHAVAEIGEKIHDSYIMKQQLSEAQVEELHNSLPAAFKELDHSFHHAAGMLAHAAKKGNAEIVNFYFYKLSEACVNCHAKYASHRFPAFSKQEKHEEHR